MVFSAAAWSFDWDPPYDKAINAIADLGFAGVELRIKAVAEVDSYYTGSVCAGLKALMEQRGLALTNVVVQPTGASSRDGGARRKAVEDFCRMAAVCAALGTPLITVGGSYPFDLPFTDDHLKPSMQVWNQDVPGDWDFEENFEGYLATLRQFAAICEEKGMKMALETVPSAWVRNTDAALRLLEKLGVEGVGITYDVANISMVGELPEIFAHRLNKRLFNVQMADNHGLSAAHWRPGKGKNDFGALVRALKDFGYDGPVCLELSDTRGAAGNPALCYEAHGDYEKLAYEHKLALAEMGRVCQEEGA